MIHAAWLLLITAFLLGIRHGFDLDHLATIDAITRSMRQHGRVPKNIGVLFSLGHGLVVIAISTLIGSGFITLHAPEWLDGFGVWVSTFFLMLFGSITLWNVVAAPIHAPLPTSVQNYIAHQLGTKNTTPGIVVFIGMLFALSFDTVSQVVLFSLSAAALSGGVFAGLLGVFFMLGMMLSDGFNGFFVAHIIQRADNESVLWSRILGFGIAAFSLSLGFINCMHLFG